LAAELLSAVRGTADNRQIDHPLREHRQQE
jgi:hypothetical protein